jgi:ubiquinone/menaquinone biosynthesis C-methylase UbiE
MLDLACGKGAVSVNICKELNIETKGIDIIPEFIDYAKEKAIEYGVQNRCKFEVEDINKAVQKEKEYDIVIFGAAEDILGTPFETLQKLKQTVKENGYILIDEAYVETKNQNVKYETYEYLTLDEWKELFKNTNLKLIETLKAEENMQKEMNDYNTNKIVKRAEELIKKYPSKKKLFEEYIENQKAESEDLQENIVGVTWILQRGKDYDK